MKTKKDKLISLPNISVIIPCRNEEKHIESCIKSIFNTDYPKNKLEILVIDGLSTDKTPEILKNLQKSHKFIKILKNKNKTTPFALNIGLKKSRFNIISRIDAHCTVNKKYFSEGIKCLLSNKADSVGGILIAEPEKNSLIHKSISYSLNNKFGTGNATYRFKIKKEKEVDTVFGFFCKKSFLKKIGPFNNRLKRGQDMEYNIRIKKQGGKIILNPNMVSIYKARTFPIKFLKHNFLNGKWAILPFKFSEHIPVKTRHLVPLVFVSVLTLLIILSLINKTFLLFLLSILLIHLILGLAFSTPIAKKEKSLFYLISMPITFLLLHISYGLGSLYGLLKYSQGH